MGSIGKVGLAVLFGWGAFSQAAGEAGNGGDVVICKQNGKVVSAKVMDFHEAEVMRPELSPALEPETGSHVEKVAFALKRLARLDPERARAYEEKAAVFFSNTRFVTGVELQDIPDSGYVPVPSHCEVKQIAVQKTPLFPEDRLYTINRDLWDLMDEDHKAGLMLHEIVYGELIGYGHKNSVKARYFTSLVSSALMDTMAPEEYERRLRLVVGGSGPLPGDLQFTSPEYNFTAAAGSPTSIDLMGLLKGQGSGSLQWTAVGTLPAFATLDTSRAKLNLIPSRADVGTHSFRLAVRDSDGGALALVTVEVVAQNLPPYFKRDPIAVTTRANQAFMWRLASEAHDPDGDPLTFRKISGPAWLMITPDGNVMGTPREADAGENRFVLTVTDGNGLSARVNLVVEVRAE